MIPGHVYPPQQGVVARVMALGDPILGEDGPQRRPTAESALDHKKEHDGHPHANDEVPRRSGCACRHVRVLPHVGPDGATHPTLAPGDCYSGSVRTGSRTDPTRRPWALWFTLLGTVFIACSGPSVTPAPNIVLILIDTLRADHVGAYGYPRPTSPNIDRLAAAGVLFG